MQDHLEQGATQMPNFTYWIQHADFTVTDGHAVGADEAVQAFASHDWDAEWRSARDLGESGATDVCPPGIGFRPEPADGDLLLHIQPVSWDAANIDYLYTGSQRRLFGLLPALSVERSQHARDFPLERVKEVIALFLAGRHADLLALLERHR